LALDGKGRRGLSQGRRPAAPDGAGVPDPGQRHRGAAALGESAPRGAGPAPPAARRLGPDDGLVAEDARPDGGRAWARPGAGLALAGMGARVIVNYRADSGAAEETAREAGGEAVKADVGDPEQVSAMVKSIGQVDVLVNNAGAVRDKLLLRMTQSDWDDIIRT